MSLIRHLPAGSETARELNDGMWDLTEQLLAGIYDQLAVANWQRAGNKRARRPKPLPRPGAKPHGKRYGTRSMSIDEWRKHRAERVRGGASSLSNSPPGTSRSSPRHEVSGAG